MTKKFYVSAINGQRKALLLGPYDDHEQALALTESNFEHLRNLSDQKQDGLVLLGCGGDLMEWVDGVRQLLIDKEVASADFAITQALKVETTGGRIDLCLLFDWNKVYMSRMAMWRLQFGDCSWLSDYVVNYADQHGYAAVGPYEWEDEC